MVSLLENGLHLGATEFLHRYEQMPEVKKAELVNGIVFMASPVRADRHGEPDNFIQTWLGTYVISTPGVRAAANSTVRLSSDDVPQPDALLRILPEHGGKVVLDAKGYLQGAPELIVEIAGSSAAIDAREKFASYRRAGVLEYLLWRTEERAIDWWVLHDDEYVPLASEGGVIKSRHFPGLWLDVHNLLAGDAAAVIRTLNQGIQSPEHQGFVDKLASAKG